MGKIRIDPIVKCVTLLIVSPAAITINSYPLYTIAIDALDDCLPEHGIGQDDPEAHLYLNDDRLDLNQNLWNNDIRKSTVLSLKARVFGDEV